MASLISHTNNIVNGSSNIMNNSTSILQQAILDHNQIRDIATAQAKATMVELMKEEAQLKRKTVLTIENIDKIVGAKYSETLNVVGVKESDTHYEFTLAAAAGMNTTQMTTILLHRRQTSDTRYIMEYNGKTLWVSKDRLSTIAGIIECMVGVLDEIK